MGLIEIFVNQKIVGRTSRVRTKGLIFFFLMCLHPDEVIFPSFVPTTGKQAGKRSRSQPFSLDEKGRLVALIDDVDNMDLVSMLMKKWSLEDLDAKLGRKGVGFYWDQLSKIFNDRSYDPGVNQEFVDHMTSVGQDYVYKTNLIPEFRTGDFLRKQWSHL